MSDRKFFSRVLLGVASWTSILIGAMLVFKPHAFFEMNEVALGTHPNMLSEVRAPGGLLILAGIVMAAGAAYRDRTRTGLVTAVLVYGGYGLARVFSVVMDGWPSQSLVIAMVVELVIGALASVALMRFRQRPVARRHADPKLICWEG